MQLSSTSSIYEFTAQLADELDDMHSGANETVDVSPPEEQNFSYPDGQITNPHDLGTDAGAFYLKMQGRWLRVITQFANDDEIAMLEPRS